MTPEDREVMIKKNLHTCTHFNGVTNDRCLAGVKYDDLREGGRTLPCTAFLRAKSEVAVCDEAHFPTKEQATKDVDTWIKKTDDALLVAAAAHADALSKGLGKGNPGKGSMPCLICGKQLNYSVASNGHMMGRCQTIDCARWME